MLNPEDRRAIEGLFQRLQDVEAQSGERDRDAELLIQRLIASAPAAPYYLAQTVLVQEHALKVAEQRISELESETRARQSGGLLGGLFGGGANRGVAVERQEPQAPRRGGPWDRGDDMPARGSGFGAGGGGFLAGAAQTAMGVAGGVLLGNAIAGMFGAGEAHAGEVPQDGAQDAGADQGQESGQDAGHDAGDTGGDFGDAGGGDFDFGGDF